MDGFKNIEIKNFRGIDHLEIDDFSRVNLVLSKKTKFYAYLETLLGKTRIQKKLIKDSNRIYDYTQHWNLDAEYQEPLKSFLVENIMHTK